MSEGDRAAWKARFGCPNPAQWMLRSEGLSRCGEILWPVACCTSHLGPLVKVASGCEVKNHVVWPIGDEEPRRVRDLVDEAVAIESAQMQAHLDLARTGAARARREYDELDVVIRDAMHELGASVPQTHEGRVRAIQTMGRVVTTGKDVAGQRDRLADTVRSAVRALGAEFPPSDVEGCAASIRSMGQTIQKYRQWLPQIEAAKAKAASVRQVDVHRLGLPRWFDGPLHYWRQQIFQETGQSDGIMSIVVSRRLGRELGLCRDECTVCEGAVRIEVEQLPSGPELCKEINRRSMVAEDPDRWIQDLDAAAKRAAGLRRQS